MLVESVLVHRELRAARAGYWAELVNSESKKEELGFLKELGTPKVREGRMAESREEERNFAKGRGKQNET